jgi:hypothetical protein
MIPFTPEYHQNEFKNSVHFKHGKYRDSLKSNAGHVTSQFAITTTAISACTQISMLWESLSP